MSRHLIPRLASMAMALFLVVVLPACWYGAMARASVLLDAPSTANNNEEREEHDEREEREGESYRTRPPHPPGRDLAPPQTALAIPVPVLVPAITASVAPALHPSQFSVRRLR